MGNGAIIPIRHDNISCNPVPCFEKNQWFEGPVQSHSIAPCWTSAPPNSQDHGLADPGDASLSGNRNREPSTLNPKPKPLNPTHRLMLPEPRNPIYTGNWALGLFFQGLTHLWPQSIYIWTLFKGFVHIPYLEDHGTQKLGL